MNKSFLKFVADFGPLLIFFTIYYKSGNNLSVAIPPLIIATIVAVVIVYFIEKKIPYVPLIGGVIISLFGGLTLYFDNPVFLYMKPTIINIIFSAVLIVGKISVITLVPVIGVIIMMFSVMILSKRENMTEFNNSLENIESIDKIK